MRPFAPVALAAMISAAGASAAAQDDAPATRDLACMVVATVVATQVSDETTQQGAIAGFGYYMGRLKGRDPGFDVKTRLIAETKALVADPVRFREESFRCGADMEAWGRETREIGEALRAVGRELTGKPPG